MTATLTERSEGTPAHKGFNVMRELENSRPRPRSRNGFEGQSRRQIIVRKKALTTAYLLQGEREVVRHEYNYKRRARSRGP